MVKKRIFDIPIYGMTESEFQLDYEKARQRIQNKYFDKTDQYISTYEELFPGEKCWRYNEIVGYLSVSVTNTDLWVDLYMTDKKRIVCRSQKKHFIRNQHLNGYHFRCINMDNCEIVENLFKFINSIKEHYLPNGRYVDLEIVNNTVRYLNIKQILDDMR